jgi:Domain of unknown function (DUF4389)
MTTRAIRLVVRDRDLERSRLTVGFRAILAIPHFFWLYGWFYLATLVGFANWIATLISGTPSPMLHRFLAAYVRYSVHVLAYVSLAADPYPGFAGRPGSYPVDVDIGPPARQNRWVTGFRLVLALPAVVMASVLVGVGLPAPAAFVGLPQIGAVAATIAFLAWFVCVGRGRMPEGFQDALDYLLGYSAQVSGYVFLLTDRYPDSDPAVYEAANVYRGDPVRLYVDDELRRSRLTTFFRLALATPHIVWLTVWWIAGVFAAIANWFVLLFRGRPSPRLHRFLARLVRYQTHVYAFLLLVGNPFPGFTGRPGTYPVALELPGPARQPRLVTGFRGILAIPAGMIASAIVSSAWLAAFFMWFYALLAGRAPRGLRNLSAFALRYGAQTQAYALLVTDRYPYTGPTAGWQLSLTDLSTATT